VEHSIHLLAQPHSPVVTTVHYTQPCTSTQAATRDSPSVSLPHAPRFPKCLFPQAAYRYLGSAYRFTRNAKLKQPTFLLALFPLRRLRSVSDLGFALGPATMWAL